MQRTKSQIKSQINLNPRETSEFRTFIALGDRARNRAQKIGRALKKARRPALYLLIILGSAHAGFNIYASVLVKRELAQVRQLGEPLTLAEMAPPSVADAENAAPLYRRAYALRQFSDVENQQLQGYVSYGQEALSPTQMRALLERNRDVVALARQGAARADFRSDVDWTQTPPAQIELWHYMQMRALARLLSAQAVQEARDGNSEAALRDARAIYRMGDQLKNEPMLVGFLVGRAISIIADSTLDEVLEAQPISATQARAFEASLPRTDWSVWFRRGFLGQRALNLWAFENMRSDPVTVYHEYLSGSGLDMEADEAAHPVPTWAFKPLALLWSPLSKLDEVYYLRLWKQRLAALQPIQVPLGQVDPTAKFADELPPYAAATHGLYFEYENAYGYRDGAEVARRQRQIVLAIAAFRSANHGVYPLELTQIAEAWNGKLPLDPYNNRSFGYRSDGQSFTLYRSYGQNFTLYSVGPNYLDDNGRNAERESYITRESAPAGSDDVVWNYRKQRAR